MTFDCPDTMKAQPTSGAVVLSDDLKNPAMEKLDLVRKWSINTYKVNLFLPALFIFYYPLCFCKVFLFIFLYLISLETVLTEFPLTTRLIGYPFLALDVFAQLCSCRSFPHPLSSLLSVYDTKNTPQPLFCPNSSQYECLF